MQTPAARAQHPAYAMQSPATAWQQQQHPQALPPHASPCQPAFGACNPSSFMGSPHQPSPYGPSVASNYSPYATSMMQTPAFSHLGACGLFQVDPTMQATCAMHAATHTPPQPMYPPPEASFSPRQAQIQAWPPGHPAAQALEQSMQMPEGMQASGQRGAALTGPAVDITDNGEEESGPDTDSEKSDEEEGEESPEDKPEPALFTQKEVDRIMKRMKADSKKEMNAGERQTHDHASSSSSAPKCTDYGRP